MTKDETIRAMLEIEGALPIPPYTPDVDAASSPRAFCGGDAAATEMIIEEPARRVPVVRTCDVMIAGAGPAGMAAAIAAARAGAKTCLVDTHGCLGGIWTAGLLAWMFEMGQPGIPREITRRLDSMGARIGTDPDCYTYDIEQMKLLLETMCAEAGVAFQLHTRAVQVTKRGDSLEALITESKSGREAWRAAAFVDATGDGDVAALAGCAFDVGREGSGECQPMTFMALIAVKDAAALGPCISFYGGRTDGHLEAVGHFREHLAKAGVETSYARPTLFQVRGNLLAFMVNHEYGVSATDARQITEASVRARAEVHAVVRALARLGGPWEGVALVSTCEHIGVREGRRIQGLHRVTQAELAAGARHLDAVCRVSFGVDVHCTNPAQGKGQEVHRTGMRPYDIPLRALIARDVDNLLLAGRCISGDFIAHSSYRVTGVAAATGQAAGRLAAVSALRGRRPSDIPAADVLAGA